MRPVDFSDEMLLLADLVYSDISKSNETSPRCEEQQAKDDKTNQDQLILTNVRKLPAIERSSEAETPASENCNYATPCWAFKRMGWIEPWRAVANMLGGTIQSNLDPPAIRDTQPASRKQSLDTLDGLLADAWPEVSEDSTMRTTNEKSVPEPLDPPVHTSGWQPRCPHCDTPNEYGHVMCDPVLPRVCEDGPEDKIEKDDEGTQNGRDTDQASQPEVDYKPLLFLSMFF